MDFRQVSQNSATFLCNYLSWSYPVASSGKAHQVGCLNFIQQGLGNARHTSYGKTFPTRLFKD